MTRAGRAMVGTLAVVVALALSACGKSVTSGGASGGGSAAGTAAEKVYQQLNGLPANQQRAQAIAQAKKEGTLELYTSLTDDVAAEVKQAFEQQTGVKTNVFRANSETVLQRVLQETSANRTGNDAVETNFGEMGQLSKQGVLADYRGAAFASVPESGRFPGWLADRRNIMLPAWNTKLIRPGQEPRSGEDRADPRRHALQLHPPEHRRQRRAGRLPQRRRDRAHHRLRPPAGRGPDEGRQAPGRRLAVQRLDAQRRPEAAGQPRPDTVGQDRRRQLAAGRDPGALRRPGAHPGQQDLGRSLRPAAPRPRADRRRLTHGDHQRAEAPGAGAATDGQTAGAGRP